MTRLALLILGWLALALPSESKPVRPGEPDRTPLVLDADVIETETRESSFPFVVDPKVQASLRAVRLLVSDDNGKTWKVADERKPIDARFAFRAPKDGLYWFATQFLQADGKIEPAEARNLTASLKVYVNKDRRPVVRKRTAPTDR